MRSEVQIVPILMGHTNTVAVVSIVADGTRLANNGLTHTHLEPLMANHDCYQAHMKFVKKQLQQSSSLTLHENSMLV